ncbi:hypothetical protein DICA4_E19790 [Diutina catenulata]
MYHLRHPGKTTKSGFPQSHRIGDLNIGTSPIVGSPSPGPLYRHFVLETVIGQGTQPIVLYKHNAASYLALTMQYSIFAAFLATAYAGLALQDLPGLAVNQHAFVTVGGDNRVELVLNSDDQLANKASKKYIDVRPDGILAESTTPTKGEWSLVRGELEFTIEGKQLQFLQCENNEGELLVAAYDKSETPKNSCSELQLGVKALDQIEDVEPSKR